MKLISNSALILGLLSTAAIANENNSTITGVEVHETKSSTLSIQNFSNEKVEIDLYDENFDLNPASGIKFECLGYEHIELQIKGYEHEYFEVPCNSRVVINNAFINHYVQGQ